MKFVKMQAVGNDYIYISHEQTVGLDIKSLAQNLSRRRFSVGSDGIITVEKVDDTTVKMRIFNADGSEGQTCGNGVRCSAVFAQRYMGIKGNTITVLTKSRPATVTIFCNTDYPFKQTQTGIAYAKADMGNATICKKGDFLCENLQKVGLYIDKHNVLGVNVGNEHLVFFTEEPIKRLSDCVENCGIFKDGVNIERVFKTELIDKNRYRLHAEIYERGSGKTLSCGSGAVGIARAFAEREGALNENASFEIITEGGSLFVTFKGDLATLYGEVVEVYKGEL